MLNINDIFDLLPHRYPYLFIDRVEEVVRNKSIVCYKNVTFNEPQFTGHFPDFPVLPGVMIIEGLAQATGILAFYSKEYSPESDSIYLLAGVDKVRFKRMVTPGDKLTFTAEVMSVKRDVWKFHCQASVDGNIVTTADIMCAEKKRAN